MRFFIDTLGCDKNTVDSEQAAGLLIDSGWDIVSAPEDADIVLINTCAFIDSAKEESIDHILGYVQLRKVKLLSYRIVVMGCLTELYEEELKKSIPEVEIWIKPSDFNLLPEIDKNIEHGKGTQKKGYTGPYDKRVALGDRHVRYIKISDGCDLGCSYCTIPVIRGPLKSRKISEIKKEMKMLEADRSLKELIFVSQSTSFFGNDTGETLIDLMKNSKDCSFPWKRLMYLDVRNISAEFLDAVESYGFLPYFDIPLQHADDQILKSMNRGYGIEMIMDKIDMIRKRFLKPSIRTTFIIGYPGEEDKHFLNLMQFVEKAKIDHVGVFTYSPQELSSSYSLGDPVPKEEKDERVDALMSLQRDINRERISTYVGSEAIALCDVNGEEGRLWNSAPEIDGAVFLSGKSVKKGSFYKVKITDSYEYDLEGEIIDEVHPQYFNDY